jgi:hypothetical protein
MSNTATSNSPFASLGEEFCWHARNFAAMYNAERVDTVHILLAAAEITPVEIHSYPELNPITITEALAAMHHESASNGVTELVLPIELTPHALEFVAKVIGFTSPTKRTPTLRDIWVALSQEKGLVSRVLAHLGIHQAELYRQASGS